MLCVAKYNTSIKVVFSRESYALKPQIESTSMLTEIITSSLLCHNDTIYNKWMVSINYLKAEHAHSQRSNLKLQSAVVSLNIRSRSLKSD